MDLSRIVITGKEYAELVAIKHTLILVHSLMRKELEAKDTMVSTYVNGDKYMDIMECLWDTLEVENAGQTEDF